MTLYGQKIIGSSKLHKKALQIILLTISYFNIIPEQCQQKLENILDFTNSSI